MKSKEKVVEESKINFIGLFRLLWKEDSQDESFDDVLKNSDLSEKDIKELKQSQQNIAKREESLLKETATKSKDNKFKTNAKTKKMEALDSKNKQKLKMNENERERE